jgi:ATP-binding cassette subfamily B protein
MRVTDSSDSPYEPENWATYRRILKKALAYMWPKDQLRLRFFVVFAVSMLILNKIAAVIAPFFFKEAVDALAPDGGDLGIFAVSAIGLTLAYGLARLMSVIFQQLRSVFYAPVGERATRVIAIEIFRHIHALSLRYHLSRQTGALSRIIDRGVRGVQAVMSVLLFSLGPLVLEFVMIAAIIVVAFELSFLAIIVATVLAYGYFTYKVTELRVQQRRAMNEEEKTASQKALDSLLNFETVRYFAAADREAARYDKAWAKYKAMAVKVTNSLAFLNAGQSAIVTAGLVGVMVLGAQGVLDGTLTVGDFVMLNAYMIQIALPLNFLGGVYREMRQSFIDMGEMFDLLDQPPEVQDKPGASDLEVSGGEVVFDNVFFHYDPDRAILKGISLHVKAGETLAVVGSTGAGKSTISRLLFRFYDVTGGAVRIDGQDVRDVTQLSLQQALGVVPQDTVLFNDTIGYNIAYGRPDASEEEVTAAARAANIHDFVQTLPKGYETLVGERGLKLSGGEKQRVGIARTILKNPKILILDEATSALDSRTEGEILSSLKEMGQGRTVVTIAHRLSTIADADRIIVLDAGEIVEEGSHAELLMQDGRYAALWHQQVMDGDAA